MRRVGLRRLSHLCTIVPLGALGLTVDGWYQKTQLPKSSEILAQLGDDPVQEMIRERQFQLMHEGTEYTLHPVANYDITGLVVTHNDISAFNDIYHTSKSVDLKDLCMIWGDNVRSDDFRKVQYWSEPWSCNFQFPAGVINFRQDQLSNTHLLAASEKVRKKIQAIHVGDQVRLRGQLVNYAPTCCSELLRKSSLVREDTGNGACEVMYVTEAEILKEGNPGWQQVFRFGWMLLFTMLGLKLILFLRITYAEVPRAPQR